MIFYHIKIVVGRLYLNFIGILIRVIEKLILHLVSVLWKPAIEAVLLIVTMEFFNNLII